MVVVSNIVVVHRYIFFLYYRLTLTLQLTEWQAHQDMEKTYWMQLVLATRDIQKKKMCMVGIPEADDCKKEWTMM